MSTVQEPTKIMGFSRVHIEDGPAGKLVGDSGWSGPNQITNLGFQRFLCYSLGSSTGSSYVLYAALGTGGAPASNATTLPGEIMSSTQRGTVTFASVASTTAQFTISYMSSDSFLTAAKNLSNVGLFQSNATNDTLFAGNTYTSSACNTNQNVYVTYQIRFS